VELNRPEVVLHGPLAVFDEDDSGTASHEMLPALPRIEPGQSDIQLCGPDRARSSCLWSERFSDTLEW